MDEFYEQEHQAWLDEQNAVISFHEIPQSEYFRAPDGVFWVIHPVAARARIPGAVVFLAIHGRCGIMTIKSKPQEETIMIALACDHGALDLKKAIMAHLDKRGLAYKDFGCYTKDSCDYPDFAGPAAQAVASGECDRGIVCCTTGIGVSITANKVKGIRCALLDNPMSARLTREHNDTNMMALGAAVTGEMLALEIVDVWLDTEFSHAERHQRRIDKVMAYEHD